MNEGDILEITLIGSYLSKPMANVFHWRVENFSGNPLYSLATSLGNSIVNLWKPIAINTAQFTTIRVLNLTNKLDLVDTALTGATGSLTGDGMPPFVAWAYQLTRATRATDHGHKRFGGVAESSNAGLTPSSGLTAAFSALGAYISTMHHITGGVGDGEMDMYPVIWGKALPARTTVNGTPLPARPETFNDISGYLFKGISTQNTRK
jgi:hypothetical protein